MNMSELERHYRDRLFELRAILTNHGEGGMVHASYVATQIDSVLWRPEAPINLDKENQARASEWVANDEEGALT